jgi:hypothetical protein
MGAVLEEQDIRGEADAACEVLATRLHTDGYYRVAG